MKIKDFLTKDNWTKQMLAQDINGKSCAINSEKAVKFCLVGAIIRLYPDEIGLVVLKIQDELGFSPGAFNDNLVTTFEDISKLVHKLNI